MKNTVLLIISLIISLIICETVLRMFTPFPISEESNKSEDPVLGYRLSPHLDDVDQYGFRNPEYKESYDIAALGDSHTYGENVSSDQTWPALLEKKTGLKVYNFGVGSYGIFSYHAILKTLINPDIKGAIIGLFPANDFEIGALCRLNINNKFWNNNLPSIDPDFENSNSYIKFCSKKQKEKRHSVGKQIINNSALISAFDILILEKLKQRHKYYYFDGKVVPVKKKSVKIHSIKTDLNNYDVYYMYNIFNKIIKSWAILAQNNNISIGILIIPSKERVIYEYFNSSGKLNILDPTFVSQVETQIILESRLSDLFNKNKISYKFALDYTLNAFISSLHNNNNLYPMHDGHPYENGYHAYALAAYDLWKEITFPNNLTGNTLSNIRIVE